MRAAPSTSTPVGALICIAGLAFAGVISAAPSTGPTRIPATSEAFVPLFNGSDLTGWHPVNVAADTFRVRDGVIVASGAPYGVLRSARSYENFILEFEWRLLRYGGNSGIFVWAEPLPAPGAPFPRSIEIDMLDPGYETLHTDRAQIRFTGQGDILPVRGARMTAVGRRATAPPGVVRSFPSENRIHAAPEWNHYRIECRNGEIRLSVNGKQVTMGRDSEPRQGFICLQSEDGEAEFRNLRIQELPGGDADPSFAPPYPYQGFNPIFNGINLEGWKVSETLINHWAVTDGYNGSHITAVHRVPPPAEDLTLWTERNYGNFELYVDWRIVGRPAQGEPGEVAGLLLLRGPNGPRFQLGREIAADATEPADGSVQPPINAPTAPIGKWNRLLLTLQDRHLVTRLNGVVVADRLLPEEMPAWGPIGLDQVAGSLPIEFGNLLIREFP